MKKYKGFKRADRVSQQIHEIVARLFITEVNDPRLEEVEIVDAEVDPDLRKARIYYMMRHGERPQDEVEEVLKKVRGFLQRQLSSKLQMKYIPELEFRFDDSILKGRRIDDLLTGNDE